MKARALLSLALVFAIGATLAAGQWLRSEIAWLVFVVSFSSVLYAVEKVEQREEAERQER